MSELRWDVLFSLFNAQPLVFLLVDRARSLQQFFDLERQPLLLLGHPLVGHRLVLARVRLHLRAIECDVSEPHQTCFLAKLQDFEEERFQCLQVDQPKLVDRREVGMTFSSQHPEWNVFVGRPRDPPESKNGIASPRNHGIKSRRRSRSAQRSIPDETTSKNSCWSKWTSYRKLACMVTFDHEKLEVYQLAVEYADIAEEIAQELQPGHAHVRDQLRRASDSIVNYTAKGAGEFNPPEKARFYRSLLPDGTSLWHRKRRLTPHLLEAPTRQRAEAPSRQSQAQALCRDAHAPHQVDERTPGCMIAIGTGTGTRTRTGLAVSLRATRS